MVKEMIFIITLTIHRIQLKTLLKLLQGKGKMKKNVNTVEVIRLESEVISLTIISFELNCSNFAWSIKAQSMLSCLYKE